MSTRHVKHHKNAIISIKNCLHYIKHICMYNFNINYPIFPINTTLINLKPVKFDTKNNFALHLLGKYGIIQQNSRHFESWPPS